MLHPNLLGVICNEFPDKAWIPKFASHSEILTAAHESVRLATFDGGRYAFRGEVILFSTSDGDESICTNLSLP